MAITSHRRIHLESAAKHGIGPKMTPARHTGLLDRLVLNNLGNQIARHGF